MTKVIKFPSPVPEKFGLQRVVRAKAKCLDKNGQLNLFMGEGKVISLKKLTPFEDALLRDDSEDVQAARDLYLKAIKQKDCVADAYCNLGILEYREDNHTKAIDCFSMSLTDDPRHFEAHYNLANLYADLGNLPLAKLHYKVAIEVEPGFSSSYFNLGITYVKAKEFANAIDVLNRYKLLSSPEEQKITDGIINALSMTSS